MRGNAVHTAAALAASGPMSGLEAWVETPLHRDADGVWVRADAESFGYTDGAVSEKFLESVLRSSDDLGSNSAALGAHARDWPSEYHLSPQRAQLLRGFDYDRSSSVLEVGCGCGAVTRFLGETFDRVLAIEGSHARARLARLRTRDLANVEIVQSRLEDLRYSSRFDLVFCIGVFEYASRYGSGDDPHRAMLQDLDDLIAPGGVLVLAIENKFGLKYFGSSAEDHTGVMFEGLEGYPRLGRRAKTFGRVELAERLGRHFENVEFYYPWPDYKTPSCVMTEEMISRVDPSELISSFRSVDHGRPRRRPLFDEALVWKELAANRMVSAMANSFLIVGSKSPQRGLRFDSLARLYSNRRRAEFSTLTRIGTGPDGALRVVKS